MISGFLLPVSVSHHRRGQWRSESRQVSALFPTHPVRQSSNRSEHIVNSFGLCHALSRPSLCLGPKTIPSYMKNMKRPFPSVWLPRVCASMSPEDMPSQDPDFNTDGMTVEQAFMVESLKRALPSADKGALQEQTAEILRLQYSEGNVWKEMLVQMGLEDVVAKKEEEEIEAAITAAAEKAEEARGNKVMQEEFKAPSGPADMAKSMELTFEQELKLLNIKHKMADMSREEMETLLMKVIEEYWKSKNARRRVLLSALSRNMHGAGM